MKNFLLAFIIFSLGFSFGKHHILQSVPKTALMNNEQTEEKSCLRIYYMHSTFRCVTCNQIEKITEEFLTGKYSREILEKVILWEKKDFQEDEVIAEKFEVASSCVVITLEKNKQIVEYKRMDKVWNLIEDKAGFEKYLDSGIQEFLKKGKLI